MICGDDFADNWCWYEGGSISGQGSTHSISGDAPDYDPVAALHEVVAEITGKPVVRAPRPMGFY